MGQTLSEVRGTRTHRDDEMITFFIPGSSPLVDDPRDNPAYKRRRLAYGAAWAPSTGSIPTMRPAYRVVLVPDEEWARTYGNVTIRDASDVARVFEPLVHLPQEEIWAMVLDGRHKLLATAHISTGTANSCPVAPRDFLFHPIVLRSPTVVLVHNHPSGDAAPSREDQDLTNRLSDASRLVGVRLVDHVVVARAPVASTAAETPPCPTYFSFANAGLLSQ